MLISAIISRSALNVHFMFPAHISAMISRIFWHGYQHIAFHIIVELMMILDGMS